VQDCAVLHVGAGAEGDGVHVAAQDGVHPDGGVRAERDLADDLRGEVDVGGSGDDGAMALMMANHDGC